VVIGLFCRCPETMKAMSDSSLVAQLRLWQVAQEVRLLAFAAAGVLVSLLVSGDGVSTGFYFGVAFLGFGAFSLLVSVPSLLLWKRRPLKVDPFPRGTLVVVVVSVRSLLVERWRDHLGLVAFCLIGPYFLWGPFGVAVFAGAVPGGFLGFSPIYARLRSFERRNRCELFVKVRPRFWERRVFYVRKLSL